MDTNKTEQASPLTFPCEFTLKVFGLASDEFKATAFDIVKRQIPALSDDSIQSRLSENGKYCALSITIYATSRAQLDQIYRDLSSSPTILMVI